MTSAGKQREPERPRDLKGNQVLRLDDPSACWIVEHGELAVFSVHLRDGHEDGARRYRFSAGPGDAVFGFSYRDGPLHRVVAVALRDTAVRPGPGSDGAESRWVEAWQRSLEAPDGETTRWTAADNGDVREFNRDLLVRLGAREQDALERDRQGLADRERFSRETTHGALETLAAILLPGRETAAEGAPLFVAAHTVGRALGLHLRAPAGWQEQIGTIAPIEMISQASHVRIRPVCLAGTWWQRDCGPLLAYRAGTAEPVALIPVSPHRYVLRDPVAGTTQTVDAGVAAGLETEAHTFYRPLPAHVTRALDLVRFALRGRGRDLAMVLATAVAATLLGMFTPQATALLVDHAIPDADRALLLQIGLGLAAAAFGATLFRLSQGIALLRVETGADSATQSAVWDRLLNLRLSFFRQFSTGDLQSRVSAISQIRSYLSGTTLRSLFSGVVLLMNLVLLLYYNVMLTGVALVVALGAAAITVVSGRVILQVSRRMMELNGQIMGLVVQFVQGVAKLRVAAAENRAFARWANEYSELQQLDLRNRRIQETVALLNMGLSILATIVLFALAATLALDPSGGPGLSTGVFLAFNTAFGTFVGAIVGLSNTVTDVLAIAILRERARPILEATPEVSEARIDPGRLHGGLQLAHVTFQYKEDGPVILDDVSLRVKPGEMVALVGPSGSGKSTVMRLLLGFETPQTGSVLYDGQDLDGLDVHAVRRQMGVVLQNGRINAGSVFENVACGARISMEEAWEAARSAGFAPDVEAMPMSMHTVVSEGGTNLSGGQRQRLLITRALVQKPRILLLDEATSALDNKTQAVVSDSLEQLNVTRVVVAHRLSTIRRADRIYVIEDGRVVQQGTFDELAQEEGLFARLMQRQMA